MLRELAKKIEYAASNRFWKAQDLLLDFIICGRSLVKYVPSISRNDQEGLGGTGSGSTHYAFLNRVFADVPVSPADRLLDVGCGKGRVLAFLLKRKCPCQLHGIEYNAQVGRVAAEWAKRYDRVKIIIGDAFQIDYNDYSILTLARSFLPNTFLSFIQLLEDTLTHPITLVYWFDQQSVHLLHGRPGWTMQKRGIIDRIRGIKAARYPQGYSIWTYDPQEREAGIGSTAENTR